MKINIRKEVSKRLRATTFAIAITLWKAKEKHPIFRQTKKVHKIYFVF